MTSVNRDERAELFDAARDCLRTERRRTIDEQEAFRAFERRIRRLDRQGAPAQKGAMDVKLASGSARGLRSVRDAYEATVMSVPHYETEYGESFEQHVRVEFGPELAALLTRGTAFDTRARQAILAAASQAQETRETLANALDSEEESFATGTEELLPILDELAEYDPTQFSERSFGTLDAYRARLTVLEDHCETIVDRRQATLVDQRRTLALTIDDPDVPTYVYQNLETTYPIVSTAADALQQIDALGTAVERALGHSF